jgi:hypothetical protein
MMTTIPDNYENIRAEIVALLIPPEDSQKSIAGPNIFDRPKPTADHRPQKWNRVVDRRRWSVLQREILPAVVGFKSRFAIANEVK